MRLYLVRHGQAKAKEEDAQRHLTGAGIEEVHQMARFAKRLGVSAEQVWHSGKARAKQTAEILAAEIGGSPEVLEQAGMKPNDGTKSVAKAIAASEREGLMIVGHLPHLGRLAGRLIVGDADVSVAALPTGGMVCLEGEAGRWRVRWAVNPEVVVTGLTKGA